MLLRYILLYIIVKSIRIPCYIVHCSNGKVFLLFLLFRIRKLAVVVNGYTLLDEIFASVGSDFTTCLLRRNVFRQ